MAQTKENNTYKPSPVKLLIIVLILAALGVAYYFYLDYKADQPREKQVNVSTTTKVVSKDLSNDYFQTPREVVEFYSDIMVCYYNEDPSDEQFEMLMSQARKCFDKELLEGTDEEQYATNLKLEIESYKKENTKLNSYVLDKNSEVEKFKEDKKDYARLKCTYYMKGKKNTAKSIHRYTLRKDEEGKWKILYWELANAEE